MSLREMTTTRLVWVLWCLLWAVAWFVVGWFTFGLGFIPAVLSVAAILIPVGKPKRNRGER